MDLSQRIHTLIQDAHTCLNSTLSQTEWALYATDLLNNHFADFHLDPIKTLEASMGRALVEGATFPSLSFSHHPMTLYASEEFNIDLYFWLPSDTLPHDHGFHGAFMPLYGDYAQKIYRFEQEVDLGEGVFRGRLLAGELNLLANNVAQTIFHAPDFIHEVVHESFCVTIVLRSKNSGEVLSDYFPNFKIKNLESVVRKSQEDWQRLALLSHLEDTKLSYLLSQMSSAQLIRWLFDFDKNLKLMSHVKMEAFKRPELKTLLNNMV